MAWTFEATEAGYNNLWRKARLKGGADMAAAEKYANIIIANEARYKKVQATTGVPWFFIGALHMRESGCDFDGVLHNGEHIIGTGRLTTLEPDGRGPFPTWEAAAEDALKLKSFQRVQVWNIARMLYSSEVYNGLGYVGHGVNSPYVWAGTTNEQLGKYIRDGVWDPSVDDVQIGTAAVLLKLAEKRPDIADLLVVDAPPLVPDQPATQPTQTLPPSQAPALPDLSIVGIDQQKLLQLLLVVMLSALSKDGKLGNLDLSALTPAVPASAPTPAPAPAPAPVTTTSKTGDTMGIVAGMAGIVLSALGQKYGFMPVMADPAAGVVTGVGPTVAGASVLSMLGGLAGAISPTLGIFAKIAGGALNLVNAAKTKQQ